VSRHGECLTGRGKQEKDGGCGELHGDCSWLDDGKVDVDLAVLRSAS
jgi:hypothetical protein